jgi:hypothetical protein
MAHVVGIARDSVSRAGAAEATLIRACGPVPGGGPVVGDPGDRIARLQVAAALAGDTVDRPTVSVVRLVPFSNPRRSAVGAPRFNALLLAFIAIASLFWQRSGSMRYCGLRAPA